MKQRNSCHVVITTDKKVRADIFIVFFFVIVAELNERKDHLMVQETVKSA